jgi:minor extracellular protease Epr
MTRRRIACSIVVILFVLTSGFILLNHKTNPPTLDTSLDQKSKSLPGTNNTTTSTQEKPTQTIVDPKYSNEDNLTPDDVSKRVVVKLNPGTDPEAIAKLVKAEIIRKGPLQYVTFALPEDQTENLLDQLRKTPGVLSVQPVRVLKSTAVQSTNNIPSDTLLSQQWGLNKIEAQKAWNLGFTGSGITVAVVDTGVDLNHPDLKDNILTGYNAITGIAGSTVTQDNNGHGTHVSGIIAAEANGVGIVGVAYQAKVLPVKALTRQGEGTDDCIADGIVWAADHGSKIINLSLGSDNESDVLKEAIQYAFEKGCLIVAAGGNQEDGLTTIAYPAADPLVLAVTATDSNDRIASFSLPGPQAALAAPGVNILSDYWQNTSGYATLDGTSMASPFVSGAAALVWSANPTLSVQQVKIALENSARVMGSGGRDNSYGYGRVDAYWAIRFADNTKVLTSPALLDWAGGIVQGGTSNTSVNLNVPSRAFGLDPTLNVTVTIGQVSNVSDLPAGILPMGDAVSLEWNVSIEKYLSLRLTSLGNPPDSNRLGYIYRWSGSRWLLIGGGANTSTISANITEPGVYRVGFPLPSNNQRIAGFDKIQTALQISHTQFTLGSDTVILATANDFSDALSGVPLAYKFHAPILLTTRDQLSCDVLTEIQRLAPKKIILLGGTAVISQNIEQQLQGVYTCQRLAGVTRYGTAAKIASALGTIEQAVVVNGTSFPDAISIASMSAQQGKPILLSETDSLPSETDTIIRQLLVTETVVGGGEAVVSPGIFSNLPTPTRLSGYTRYDTAAAILQSFPPLGNLFFIATGENYPDALTGGVVAAMNQTDIVLISPVGPAPSEISVIKTWQGKKIFVLGGTAVVPESIVQQMNEIIQ